MKDNDTMERREFSKKYADVQAEERKDPKTTMWGDFSGVCIGEEG